MGLVSFGIDLQTILLPARDRKLSVRFQIARGDLSGFPNRVTDRAG
jgi:hypothetical protein